MELVRDTEPESGHRAKPQGIPPVTGDVWHLRRGRCCHWGAAADKATSQSSDLAHGLVCQGGQLQGKPRETGRRHQPPG